ncbi:unnamed protein product [Caenorhabditis auriculariae]|uniref:Uncharacterized protein n=1 Tax=Caenorhabditis auriculariae TaxID=2777116 RepID=A0A8S1HE32_9PELO|nr:unnamed protein product [Caenorhabditis auriculariae]
MATPASITGSVIATPEKPKTEREKTHKSLSRPLFLHQSELSMDVTQQPSEGENERQGFVTIQTMPKMQPDCDDWNVQREKVGKICLIVDAVIMVTLLCEVAILSLNDEVRDLFVAFILDWLWLPVCCMFCISIILNAVAISLFLLSTPWKWIIHVYVLAAELATNTILAVVITPAYFGDVLSDGKESKVSQQKHSVWLIFSLFFYLHLFATIAMIPLVIMSFMISEAPSAERTTNEVVRLVHKRERDDVELHGRMRTIDDIWNIFGAQNKFYTKHMAMNALLSAIGSLFIETMRLSTTDSTEYEFINCHHELITRRAAISADNGYMFFQFGTVSLETLTHLFAYGGVISMSILAYSSTKVTTKRVAFWCMSVIIIFFVLLFLFNLGFMNRLSIMSVFGACYTILVVAMVAAIETVPVHLRDFAMFTFYFTKSITTLIAGMMLSYFANIDVVDAILVVLLVVSVTIYCIFTPPELMMAIVARDFDTIKMSIDQYANQDAKIDVEAIIDDVVYLGDVPSSRFSAVLNLLKAPAFTSKLFLLLLVMITSMSALKTRNHFRHLMPYSNFELTVVDSIFYSAASLLALYLIRKCGRRGTLIIAQMFILISLTMQRCVILKKDQCHQKDRPIPQQIDLAFVLYLTIKIGTIMKDLTGYLMIIEHIPATSRMAIFPFVITLIELLDDIVSGGIEGHGWARSREFQIVLVLLGMTAALFVDTTDYSAVAPAEIPCYKSKQANDLDIDFSQEYMENSD